MTMRHITIIVAVCLLVGCSSRVMDTLGEEVADDSGAGTGDPDPTPLPDPPDDPPDPSTGGDGNGDGDGDGDGDSGSTFLGDADTPPAIDMCDFWADEPCPPGEKCQAIPSTPGSGTWDATVCVPYGIDGVGETCCLAGVGDCLVEGPAGTDSCDATSICMDVDPDTLLGECVEYCVGPQSDPSCPQSLWDCWQAGGGILNLCLSECDPLVPGECPDGQNCTAGYEAGGDLIGFQCFAPGTAEPGTYGDACECANCCQQGHMCAEAEEVGLGCNADFCCTEYCDLDDPDVHCEGADQVCVPLFPPDDPHHAHVGQCRVPE